MHYETLLTEITGGIATVTLNRPEVRNAFNEVVIRELAEAIEILERHPEVRVIVFAANGPTFCAGADLNWMKKSATYSMDENLEDAQRLSNMLYQVYGCQKPVIAKIQGACYAGGMGLVAACDIAVVSDQVQFCLSEVKLGLIPATIAPYVVKAMGANAARRYFITAECFSAQQALRMGFVHEVVAADQLNETVANLAKSIIQNGPNAVMEAKWLVDDMANAEIDEEMLEDMAERIAVIRASKEAQEGIAAFLEKRQPNWSVVQEPT